MEAEDVGHGVEAGLLVEGPEGGTERAVDEDVAALGAMGELDPLALAGEDHRMVADHRAAAQRCEADGAAGPRAGDAVAAAHGSLVEGDAPPLRRGAAEKERGAGGGVDLVAMMHLDDLDVVVRAEDRGGAADEAGEKIDADAHIAGTDDAAVACRSEERSCAPAFEALR